MEKTVALVIAHEGFQPIEYGVPKKILENDGYTVVTVCDKPGKAEAAKGIKADVDTTIDQLDINTVDGLFFVGGSSALAKLLLLI